MVAVAVRYDGEGSGDESVAFHQEHEGQHEHGERRGECGADRPEDRQALGAETADVALDRVSLLTEFVGKVVALDQVAERPASVLRVVDVLGQVVCQA